MSVLVEKQKKRLLFVKGAPEAILERCSHIRIDGKSTPLTPTHRSAINAKVSEWAASALRVLAFATVDSPVIPAKLDPTAFAKIEVNYCSYSEWNGLCWPCWYA